MERSHYSFHALKPRNTILFIGTVAGLLGFVIGSPLLIFLFAACVTTMALSLWQSWGLLQGVAVQREHHSRVFQGNSVAVTLTVTGKDDRAPELLLVEDNFPPSTTSRIRRLVEYPLGRDVSVAINFMGLCEHRRGLYVLGPVRMQACDALGFFRRELLVDEFSELVIYPQAVDLQQTDLLGEGTLAHVGLETKPRTGVSEEFQGIREYRPGDSLRIVHWRTSARHGNLMVKEFEEEITTEVAFFLDLGRMGLAGIGDQTSVEYGIKCCASLAKRAVERGHQVALYSVGQNVDRLPAGSGTQHLLALLDRLAFMKPEGESGFLAVVGDLALGLPRGSTAVLIMGATTVDFDQISRAVKRLQHRHVLPVVVLIDDRAFIKIFKEQEDRHFTALPLEEIERLLRLMGVRVHVVRRAKSMAEALLHGLEREAI